MKKDANRLAEKFLNGHYENNTKQSAKAIVKLEDCYPDFAILEKMLQSKFDASLEAALYIIYNKGEPCPPHIVRIIESLASHPNREIRLWAQSSLT